MGIFVKAVAKCDGWYGTPKGKRFQQVPCTADNGKPAQIDIDLEVAEHEISDVNANNRRAVVMDIVDEKGYRFSSHANSPVQCPVCAKILSDQDAAYKAAHPEEDGDPLSLYF